LFSLHTLRAGPSSDTTTERHSTPEEISAGALLRDGGRLLLDGGPASFYRPAVWLAATTSSWNRAPELGATIAGTSMNVVAGGVSTLSGACSR
jgi:hypothetical protein